MTDYLPVETAELQAVLAGRRKPVPQVEVQDEADWDIPLLIFTGVSLLVGVVGGLILGHILFAARFL